MNPYTFPDNLLNELLGDDSPYGDATTWGLGIGDAPGRLVFRARHAQVACCTEEAVRMGALRGLCCEEPPVRSGTPVEAGHLLLTLYGRAADLHTVWKPAQTLMEYAAGIASAAAELVAAGRRGNPEIAVACTRKQVPGAKAMSVKAILAGGAVPHRLGLSETLLVFAEHRAFLGDEPPAATVRRLRRCWPERMVVVEVAGPEEAMRWVEAGADVIQLEKCTPEVVAQVVELARPYPAKIAAAGGVNASNAEAYARAGAHVLVSSAPYNAKPRDVAVTLEPVG
ncbi:ModD protein [Propionivibrio limicola]|uniref:ModD protein n=1 Tax=Propionivibrio limicola TaxID=167645 RepID=UPI0012918774|nr:ModD protein [Propionivibrio limicola]